MNAMMTPTRPGPAIQPATPGQDEMARAFAKRDPAYDGLFFVAVRTTGIFCRPSCPSRPLPRNTEFLHSVRQCLEAGYRPCLRCHPLRPPDALPDWARTLLERVETTPGTRVTSRDLRDLGVTPERARRWFVQHYGMSFTAWSRAVRLASAFHQIRGGASVDDAVFDAGYASHSGFRDAIQRSFGTPPGRLRTAQERLIVSVFESPVGPLLLAANEEGLVVLDFLDRRKLGSHLRGLARVMNCPVVPGDHPHLKRTRDALRRYFAGEQRTFDLPLAPRGTDFQRRVWTALQQIPYGDVLSYEDLARRLGKPGAHRAVARANASNRLCIVLPCHRVVGKDGQLTGYGGGLWRKRWLLALERGEPLPGSGSGSGSVATASR